MGLDPNDEPKELLMPPSIYASISSGSGVKRRAQGFVGTLSLSVGLLIGVPMAMIGALVGTTAEGQVLQPGFDLEALGVTGGSRAFGVAIADFTSDGVTDLVAGDTAGDVRLFEGLGDGRFEPRGVVVNMSFTDAFGLVAGDFDRDGFQDFALGRASDLGDGEVILYLGRGDGTFLKSGSPELGLTIGDAGNEAVVLAAADVDGDGDLDLAAGDVSTGDSDTADVVLFRNQLEVLGGALAFVPETILRGTDRGFSPDPEDPPYFPPDSGFAWEAYGLAFGDPDGDGDVDLFVVDQAQYLYIYANDGTGRFAPIRYDAIASRPFAFARLDPTGFAAAQAAIATGDLNSDGRVDFAVSYQNGSVGTGPGEVFVWLGEGVDDAGRPTFADGGLVGSAGTDVRGLAIGQLDPEVDRLPDILFGNFQGELWGLFADLTDSDGDGIIDDVDNAPLVFNPPIVDMDTDGGLNRFDQLDADDDGLGDPVDPDDDNDGVSDEVDNCVLTANSDQADFDGDGLGDACDPKNDLDSDGDGVADGPFEPERRAAAIAAKARWARSDTHFVIRIDALSRAFQNEFTQVFTDAAILDPESWEEKKFDSYNGIGDAPALPGFQVPADLPGGLDLPLTLLVIPKKLWDAFGDPDPIRWINDRNGSPNLELGQHGTYHANNTPLGDWATLGDRNFFACETCGLDFRTVYQLLRIGRRTLLGEYAADPWIQRSGADPETSPRIDWSDAANPLISYAPPFNTSDPVSREATAQLGYPAFSASVFEEQSPIFSPNGSFLNEFDDSGMFHASALVQVDPEDVGSLASLVRPGELNTWLIEEVEWSTRFCNDQPRLTPCDEAPGGINRENNMVDPERWQLWLELLAFARDRGEVMTMGGYALAVSTDNCPAIANPGQADLDADGRGDACDVERFDVKPGSFPNAINPASRGLIPVALLAEPGLDLSEVRIDSLGLGPDRASAAHGGHFEDVDGDGLPDLVTHHPTQQTGVAFGDDHLCLTGTIGETDFEVCDLIETVGRSNRPVE
jgi:hypothetical protein